MEKCSSVVEAIDWRFETGFPIGYLYGPLAGWDGRKIACFFPCLDGAGVGLSTFQSQYVSSSEVTRNEISLFRLATGYGLVFFHIMLIDCIGFSPMTAKCGCGFDT